MTRTTVRRRIEGWPIVGWATVLMATLTTVLLVVYGAGAPGLRVVIRVTARTSLALFTGAFTASALATAYPTPLTSWLLRNRRYLGVSFAVSHLIHLVAIIALAYAAPDFQLAHATLIGGGLAYVFIAAMTATSFDRSAAWLGPRAWRTLHSAGVYYIWFIFFISYAPRAAQSIAYVPLALILVAALGIRVLGRRRVVRPVPAALR
jgi:hypothetical protein